MRQKEYYCTTPFEISELMEGWSRRHARYLEGVRIIAHTIAQVNTDKKLPTVDKWLPLVTDEKASKGTREEVAAAKALIRQARETGNLKPIKIVDG